MKKIKRLPNKILLLIIIVIVFLKIIFFLVVKNDFLIISLGGGNDADYYDDYATGKISGMAANVWPIILKFFNDFGIYSRDITSYLLFLSSLFFIPKVTANLSGLSLKDNQEYYFYIFILCLIYPSIFFYTFDVYRDVFMVICFLVGCYFVKKSLNSSNLLAFIFYFVISILTGFLLLALRPYLGYAFLIAILLWKIRFTKKRLIIFAFLYFLALFLLNYFGFLDFLTEYRSGFEEVESGSTLGLDFSNSIMFIPNLFFSTLGQLFGLYITNPIAVIIFIIETIPFFFMLVYIIKNIKLADNFVRFLILFFVIYASVWLIGNDNLGTALRLRFYNYFAVYICFFYILRLKKLSLTK